MTTAPVCEADGCETRSIVGWGPPSMWLCQAHFEEMLTAAGRNIDQARMLLGKTA